MNFELSTRDAVSTGNAQPDSCRKESGYARVEERWSASVSRLVWEATTSTKHDRSPLVLAYLNERYWPRFLVVLLSLVHFSVHFLHHHTRDKLEKGDPTDQGYCQQGTSSEKELSKNVAQSER